MGRGDFTVCRMGMRRAAFMIEPDVPSRAAARDARDYEAEHQVTGGDLLPTLDGGSVQGWRVNIGLFESAQRFSTAVDLQQLSYDSDHVVRQIDP